MKMRFIDSNLLAYAFYRNQHTDNCQDILKQGGIINTLNLIEAFHIIEYETSRDHAVKAIRSLLKLNFKIIPLDTNTVFNAIKQAINHRLLIFDLIHYVTALEENCREIVSYDSDFDNLNIKRVTSL